MNAPTDSEPSHEIQPSTKWRFWAVVRRELLGRNRRQCFLMIWKPP